MAYSLLVQTMTIILTLQILSHLSLSVCLCPRPLWGELLRVGQHFSRSEAHSESQHRIRTVCCLLHVTGFLKIPFAIRIKGKGGSKTVKILQENVIVKIFRHLYSQWRETKRGMWVREMCAHKHEYCFPRIVCGLKEDKDLLAIRAWLTHLLLP
jgi:hypothetical protein